MDDERQMNSGSVLLESRALCDTVAPIDSKSRLAALENLEILDAPQERNFELLTELANSLLSTPVSLITLVAHDRQFFVSSSGLQEPWATRRETPLSHSFCQHVVTRNEPLVITDAREHPLVCENLAIRDLGVAAYLGVPLVHGEQVLGSFCVIDGKPREWTSEDLGLLGKLASLTASELSNRKAAARKQFELESRLRQSQKMEAIGQLATGIAHDFNNVLFGIKISADLLKRELVESSSIAHTEKIDEAVNVAKGIVKQLLTWSRPEQGDLARQISLTQVVDQTLPLLKTALSPSVDIVLDVSDDACVISGDRSQIQQVLVNLCTNADHASRGTGGQIVVSVKPISFSAEDQGAKDYDVEMGEYVELQVTDQGHGIPSELLSRIHDPYFTTKPIGEGTGLGLWTVFGIVNRHGAKLKVASEPDQGTTFAILFPRGDLACKEISSREDTNPSTPQNVNVAAKLVIVEDDWIIADGLKMLFEQVGHDVTCFTKSREAWEHIQSHSTEVDLVLTDRAMPDLSGDELVEKCKSMRPSLPIIVCSGFVEKLADGQKNSVGADAYCLKPFESDDLIEIVAELLRKRNE